jgi:hypothetical protein
MEKNHSWQIHWLYLPCLQDTNRIISICFTFPKVLEARATTTTVASIFVSNFEQCKCPLRGTYNHDYCGNIFVANFVQCKWSISGCFCMNIWKASKNDGREKAFKQCILFRLLSDQRFVMKRNWISSTTPQAGALKLFTAVIHSVLL